MQIVVNNAGTTHRNKPVLEVTEAEFDRVYAVNVKSIYWSVQEFVPYFREQGGGAFINIASTAGVRPRPGLVWYNGSKGAVIIASKSLAVELGPDRIRVNCVNPVIGETALLSEFMGVEDTPKIASSFSPAFRSGASRRRRISPTPRCIWLRMRRSSSPACASKWTAGAAYKRCRMRAARQRGVRSISVFPRETSDCVDAERLESDAARIASG